MKRIFFGIGRALGATGRATVALVGICGVVAALANYAVTQGSGTNFGSIVVSTVHYAQQLICDSVTPAQCVTVSAAGAAKVDGSAVTQPISAASLPTHGVTVASGGIASGGVASGAIASGAVASGAYASGSIASGSMVDLGAQADAAAAADNSTASLIALLKRTNQNLTAVNTTAAAATPAGTNRVGYTTDDPCNSAATKVYTPVNVVTATNVVIAGVSAKKKYLCGIFLYPGGTDNIAVYQATTGTSCATAATDIFGGHTTATGFIATAQAGFVVGTGSAAFAATNTVNTDICITTSAAVQLSGAVVTVDQ